MADLNFYDSILMKWLPPKSKQVEIYATNASSITIEPKIGYRHKLLHIGNVGANNTSSTLDHEALDIILGAKTVARFPDFMWGSGGFSIGTLNSVAETALLPQLLVIYMQRNILDLLPDAAEDEPITLSYVSGTAYSVTKVIYAEYPSDNPLAHDVPGGSDYWRKYFFAWFSLLSTAVKNGQQLTESGEPFGMSLLGLNGRVPPNRHFHQFGIQTGYMSGSQNSSITNYTVYNALHEWKNDEELFTPDTHAGLYINQYNSYNLTDAGNPLPVEVKREEDFNPNDSLQLYTDVTSVTGSGSTLWVVIDGILEDLSKKPAGAGGP